MDEIEDIESWVGAEVVDPEGAKVGKLDELYLDTATGSAGLASVKSGLLGHRHLVPLVGATFSRGHVRVAFGKELVTSSPDLGTDGVTNEGVSLLGSHYGLERNQDEGAADDVRFELASTVRARAERAEADLRRADELEAQAEQKDREAAALLDAAHERESGATGAQSERDRLLAEADDARRAAGESGEPGARPAG